MLFARCFWDQIPAQPSSISPRSFRHLPKSCRKRQSPTMARRLLGESLGEARRRLRRLLLEEREASQVAQTSCVEKWRKGWRRLLLEEAWGSSQRVAATTPGGSLGEARRGSRRLLLETLPEMLRDPAQTFAGRYFLKANWGKGHEAPSNEILQFPWVFPHFGQKSWGPPHGFPFQAVAPCPHYMV